MWPNNWLKGSIESRGRTLPSSPVTAADACYYFLISQQTPKLQACHFTLVRFFTPGSTNYSLIWLWTWLKSSLLKVLLHQTVATEIYFFCQKLLYGSPMTCWKPGPLLYTYTFKKWTDYIALVIRMVYLDGYLFKFHIYSNKKPRDTGFHHGSYGVRHSSSNFCKS